VGLQITIDIFSGRPNPVIELDDNEAADLRERLAPARRLDDGEPVPPEVPTLGYRGIVISQTGDLRDERLPRRFRLAGSALFGRGLAHVPRDETVEDFICGSDGPILRRIELDEGFADYLQVERRQFLGRWKWPDFTHLWPWPSPCSCGPVYEPGWWNGVPSRQWSNNCYNYATNYRTDTFAQPGLAAGAMYGALTCASVKPAALADMLIDAPGATYGTCPTDAHLVALVIAPGYDFHWYRRDKSGWWSHKPGGTPATDRDNSNHAISNPEAADRGPYTDFCGYLVVKHGHTKIA
jgi:hypothetical protein